MLLGDSVTMRIPTTVPSAGAKLFALFLLSATALFATVNAAALQESQIREVRDVEPRQLSAILGNGAGLKGVSAQDPVGVAKTLQAPAPLLDLGLLLKDLTPKSNYSSALTQACSAIRAALPTNDFYGRFGLSPQYYNSTQHYYNARQAAPRVSPACVIYPKSGADVQKIMNALRRYSVTYAVRSQAGHSTGYNFTTSIGFSSTTGVLIDMTSMQGLTYDAGTGVARWELGYNWGTLAQAMDKYNAQVAGGRLGAVGPGLLLGGGISWFSGENGFASDLVQAYEIVLADGRLVTATRDNEFSDLWWAQKVGLNAFGIVTAISSKTVPTTQVYGGSRLFLSSDMPEVLGALAKWYQTGADACPKGFILPAITDVLVNSALTRLNIFEFFYNGPQADAEKCFADFAKFKTLYNDSKMQSYSSVLLSALTQQPAVFSGFANALYSSATETPTAETLIAMYDKWRQVSTSTDLTFLQRALTFSP